MVHGEVDLPIKFAHENQISFHQCKGFLDPIFNPNHSIHKQDENPSARDLNAAPPLKNKVALFCEKFKTENTIPRRFKAI